MPPQQQGLSLLRWTVHGRISVNRLNKRVRNATAHMIHAKARLYWKLWEEFSDCLLRVIKLDAMALLELPRGCDYWNERMRCMIDGTESHIHDFDGCMYGLTTQFGGHRIPIKKPWRLVSWEVKFDLHKNCDRKHDHGKCEGRETKVTQTHTPIRLSTSFSNQYVDICLSGSRSRCQRRMIHAAVASMTDV